MGPPEFIIMATNLGSESRCPEEARFLVRAEESPAGSL